MASPLSRLFGAARDRLTPSPADGRRQFFRRAGGAAAMAAGAGLLLPDDAWAGVQERANEYGIVPGTVVDANGNPVRSQGSDTYLGEIMLTPYNFAVRGYAFCRGQLLAISQYSALFSLLGTVYGGDGRTTFGLPDLQGRFAMSQGTGPGLSANRLGEKGGRETVTLTTANLANHTHTHTHTLHAASAAGTSRDPANNILAGDSGQDFNYSPASAATGATAPSLDGGAAVGGQQAFNIQNPFLVLNYQIALQGIFPSRS